MGRLKKEGPQVALIRSYRALQEQKKFTGFSGRGHTTDRKGVHSKLLRKYKKKKKKPIWAFSSFFGTPTHLLYAGGDGASTSLQYTITTRYNIATNKWEDHIEKSMARFLGGGASIRGIAYIIGGAEYYSGVVGGIFRWQWEARDTGEYYHKGTHTWTSLPLRRGSWQAGTAAKGDKIYIISGIGSVTSSGSSGIYNNGEVYDVVTKQWSSTSNMITPRRQHTLTAVPDQPLLIATGGYNASGLYTTTAEKYNTETDTWTAIANPPNTRRNAAAVVLGDLLYIMGGYLGGGGITNNVETYNYKTDTWSSSASNMLAARQYHSAVAHNGKIYVTGGRGASPALTHGEVYDPKTNTWTALPNFKRGRRGGVLLVI